MMKKHHILIAEDDEWMQRCMQMLLDKEYDLIIVGNGKDAEKQALKRKPDLIVTDIIMPEMNGWTLVKRLRSHPEFAFVPIVFLTALNTKQNRLQCYRLGADDFLAKPFDYKEFLVRVQNAIKRSNQIKEQVKPQRGLSGSFEQIGLPSVLMMLEMEQKSGILTCKHQEQVGHIYFSEGSVIAAKIEKNENFENEGAIFCMLKWSEGTFEFYLQEVNVEKQITNTITFILLEGSRRIDEEFGGDELE